MATRDPRDPTAKRDDLRARKRLQAERRIQSAALGLFDRYGFDAVTVEQVAAAADVSVMTVYRYFATKENLVLQDKSEGYLTDAIVDAIRNGYDIPAAVEHILEQLPAQLAEDAERDARVRIRLTNEVPAIAGAAHIRARARARQLAEALPGGAADGLDARVQALATLAALEAATDHWNVAPDAGTLRDACLAAVRMLRTPW